MGEALLIQRGRGTGLNFKVVGSSAQPDTPRENTIWVDTDIEVNGVLISAIEPTEAEPGAVWVQMGESDHVKFNALKRNWLMVRAKGCKQWDGTVWVFKPSMIYQKGEWKALIQSPIYIYNEGATEIQYKQYSSGDNYKNSETTYEDVTCWRMVTNATKSRTILLRSNDMVELDGYDTLKALVKTTRGYGDAAKGDPNVSLYVSDVANQGLNDQVAAYDTVIASTRTTRTQEAWTEMSLDISALTGTHYVGIGIGNRTAGAAQLYVRALWLE